MIEMLKYYARCNQAINAQMMRIIEAVGNDLFNCPVDGYYQSIGEILNHCYVGDMSWLNSFRTIRGYAIFRDPVFDCVPRLGEFPFSTWTEFKAARVKLDRVIVEWVDEIQMEDLMKVGRRMNRLGDEKEHLFWKALIHMFNHQTHHRGQVSQILDQLKIENDYSNMILIG